ncbi:MAG: hypothetical protein K9K67_13460 [Bacteriovoracaceae bacterium]|nr:hypothetical protein [Bacteriovoracaceae bacterium]
MQRRHQNYIKQTLFALLTLLVVTTSAQEFIFEHSDCVIRFKEYDNGEEKLLKKAISLLKERSYSPQQMIENKRVLPGELYFDLEVTRPRKNIFTACVVNVAIRKAKASLPTPRDETIFRKSIKRRVPRITLSGGERCNLGLKDAFVHIPHCKNIGYAGEKK